MVDSIHTDKVLVEQWKAGDERAFVGLYRQYSPRLFATILKLVKDRATAEDILQDVFAKLWQQVGEVDPDRSVGAFLFTIARNAVYNYLRRASLEVQVAAYIAAQTEEGYQPIDTKIEQAENSKAVWAAIESLPPKRKSVYIRCKIEGRSYQEVAEEFGCSVAAVNAHIVKATKAIKAHIQLNDPMLLLAVGMAFQAGSL